MRPLIPLISAALLAFSSLAAHAFGSVVKTEHVTASLISEHSAIAGGQPFTVGLKLDMAPHWHTYWLNAGDSGLPTRITWELPPGFSAGPIEWPYPQRIATGPLMNFGYEGTAVLLSTITPPATLAPGTKVPIKAKVDWLVCKDICIPESGAFTLNVDAAGGPQTDATLAPVFNDARSKLPQPVAGWTITTGRDTKHLQIDLQPTAANANPGKLEFFPEAEGLIHNPGEQRLTPSGKGYRMTIPLAEGTPQLPPVLTGVMVAERALSGPHKAALIKASLSTAALPPVTAVAGTGSGTSGANGSSDLSFGVAILFALIGGLILNIMPCVFPVLGIKVLSFAEAANHDPRKLRAQGLLFLAGVLVSFLALAVLLIVLKSAGAQLGWGFQLQSPLVVSGLALLFMLIGLNLSGVFEFGLLAQSAAGHINAHGWKAQAFLSGVLATMVATPCTAPLLGASLGYTLSQPNWVALIVFAAMALGMALPVVALSFAPKLIERLPRPGPWMETFKQFMAFPMYATVAWLLWVLGQQRGMDGVLQLSIALVLVALSAWLYGRFGVRKPSLARVGGAIAAGLALWMVWPVDPVKAANAQVLDWQPFSKERVAELRGQGKAVFVDFTAAWCISCQVNKKVALHDASVVKRFRDSGVIPLKADWTTQDPKITQALAEFGRNAVPLYVFYPAGVEAQPVILPEVLTPSIVLGALDSSAPKVAQQK